MRVGFRAGRAADFEMPGIDLELVDRSARQQHLAAAHTDGNDRPILASKHFVWRPAAVFEKVVYAEIERRSNPD